MIPDSLKKKKLDLERNKEQKRKLRKQTKTRNLPSSSNETANERRLLKIPEWIGPREPQKSLRINP
jgi:hypothetical protein